MKNAHNIKARGLKAYLLRRMGKTQLCLAWIKENLALDPFDFVSSNEQIQLAEMEGDHKRAEALGERLNQSMRGFREHYLMTARDYAEMGAFREAEEVLNRCGEEYPMLYYYRAWYTEKCGGDADELLRKAEACSPDYCFPNKLEDLVVLERAVEKGCCRKAPYYLGNLYYDKLQWEKAQRLWEISASEEPEFATVHRNLALVYYNKRKDGERAKAELERAFDLDSQDVRVFLELDQLYKKLGWSFEERLERMERHPELLEQRDDLYIEYLTLVNLCGGHQKALEKILNHRFHPWEGGEGKLEGSTDNDIWYFLGRIKNKLGKKKEAADCFEKATLGTDEPAGALYYNDQPAEMILYQGFAWRELGEAGKANARFYRLLDYGERHLEDEGKIGYFAVSLPDFLIFDEDYTKKNRAHCCYLMRLANLGLGKISRAEKFFAQAETLEPSHMMSRIFLERMEKFSAATDETQTNWNSLLGYLRLRTEQAVFVESLRVYPCGESLKVQAEVQADQERDAAVTIVSGALRPPERRKFHFREGRNILELHLPVCPDRIPLWDEEEGNLCSLTMEISGNGTKTVSFGMRTFAPNKAGRLALNGRTIFLRSEANCAVFPETGHPPMDRESWETPLNRRKASVITGRSLRRP